MTPPSTPSPAERRGLRGALARGRSAGRRAAAVVALALAAVPASAYVRTTDKTTGATLAWPLPAVSWHLNRDWPNTDPSCDASSSGVDPTLAAVRASFAAWQQPCTDLRLLYAGPSAETRVGIGGSGGNVVLFRRGWCSQNAAALNDPCMATADGDCGGTYGCFDDGPSCVGRTASNACLTWGVVALTSVLYDPTTGRIMSADIEVNGWDGQHNLFGGLPQHGWYFTCFPGDQPATCGGQAASSPKAYEDARGTCSYIDLQNTVTHEAGHFVGLAHPCSADGREPGVPLCSALPPPGETVLYADRTMAPTTSPGSTSKRLLSADDVAGVCAIYPPASGGCGCGSGAAPGALSLLAAALALRPRRRAAVAGAPAIRTR